MFISSIILYYLYTYFFPPPEIPELDTNFWWGRGSRDTWDSTIRNVNIKFDNADIKDLKERLDRYEAFDSIGADYGVDMRIFKEVLDYWKNDYNFENREIYLNKYDQFVTNIQGLDIHYIHVKPQEQNHLKVIPLLMLHSSTSSCYQFLDVISNITIQREGFDFVFEVIAPNIPGHGLSEATTRPGLGAAETAVIMRNLMLRLGFKTFYLHGADTYSSSLATLFPQHILGYHTTSPTFLFFRHYFFVAKALAGTFWPSLIADKGMEDRMYPLTDYFYRLMKETGYDHIQATKPDTLGIALTDSPAGLLAFILDKYLTNNSNLWKSSPPDGSLEKRELNLLLDGVMVYWVTESITTSLRSYAESYSSKQMDLQIDSISTPVPTHGMKHYNDLFYVPDSFLKKKYSNYLNTTLIGVGENASQMSQTEAIAMDLFEAVQGFQIFNQNI